jgi:hypothetical protein
MRSPQKGRRSVFGPDIDVRMPAQQSAHLLQVLILRGVDKPKVLVCGSGADNHEQR